MEYPFNEELFFQYKQSEPIENYLLEKNLESLSEEKLRNESYASLKNNNVNNTIEDYSSISPKNSFNSSINIFTLTKPFSSEIQNPFNIDNNSNKSNSQILGHKKTRKNIKIHEKKENDNDKKNINKQQLSIEINKENEVKMNNQIIFQTNEIRHNKYTKDNVITGIKGLLIKICLELFNLKLKECNIKVLKNTKLLNLKQLDYIHKTSKKDNLEFFNQTIGIF